MTIKKLSEIISTSPVPIYTNKNDKEVKVFRTEHLKEFCSDILDMEGCFCHYSSGENNFIFINLDILSQKQLSNTYIAIIAIHEIGHAKCYIKDCKCSNYYPNNEAKQEERNILSEFHAFKNNVQEALKIGDRYLIDKTVKSMYDYRNLDYDYKAYGPAAKKVMKLKIWKELLEKAKEVK